MALSISRIDSKPLSAPRTLATLAPPKIEPPKSLVREEPKGLTKAAESATALYKASRVEAQAPSPQVVMRKIADVAAPPLVKKDNPELSETQRSAQSSYSKVASFT